jgi:two-component system sensor histidine kinase/response regulator
MHHAGNLGPGGAPASAALLAAKVLAALPRGGTLPDDVWRTRHRGILLLLWLHVPALLLFGLVRGYNPLHVLSEAGLVAGLAGLAQLSAGRRSESTIFAAVGLMTASAVLVHLSGGMIEAHFHFFVMVGVVVLYQDWLPFLIAIGFVILHHGVVGILSPADVYNHPDAVERPWLWAGVHGAGILAMSVVGIANWKLNERAQSQLARMAAIVSTSQDAIYGWTLDGMVSSWNHGAEELFGYTAEEVIGRPFAMLVPDDRMGEVRTRLDALRLGQRVEPFDTRRVRKDGSTVEVSVTVSSVRNLDGEVIGGATIARDITDRREADLALRASEERTRRVIDTARDAYVGIDGAGLITDWNRSAENTFGWARREAIGRSLAETIIPAHLRGANDLERYLAAGGRGSADGRMEITAVHLDGHELPVEVTVWQMGGGAGQQSSAFLRDITERRRTEQVLQQARDTALESSKLKSEFLATMSHEIRTPMNGVIGLTGLLLDSDLSETQHQYADGVRASGEALLGIINDILDFSKIEAGKLELETVDFDLAEALDDVATLVAESARMKGLELVVFCEPAVPTMLRGDVGRLRQILLNLASNAVKFTGDGEVVIRAGLGAPADDDRVHVRMEVVDTGIGVSPAAAERLFEPFSQADASTTRRYGGTGLGLAICRRLAEAMGGGIGVESEPGRGSTFWLELPFAPAREPAARPAAAARLTPGLRVLVVDDNGTNRLVLGAQLLAWGIAADVAPDGFVALDLLRAAAGAGHPYDLALVDMAMPGMDGLELARTISADPALRSVRLVLLSSLIVGSEEAAQAGFSARLTKPARLSQLQAAILRAAAPPQASAPAARPRPAPAPGQTLGRLLIVEDNAINQAVAKGIVAKLGYDCDVAGNGFEALEALGRRRYDAVLMDCQMPEMDGFEATARIREGPEPARDVPIVAMTASALVEDRDRCLEAGMDDYLSKPIKSADLDTILHRLLPAPVASGGAAHRRTSPNASR